MKVILVSLQWSIIVIKKVKLLKWWNFMKLYASMNIIWTCEKLKVNMKSCFVHCVSVLNYDFFVCSTDWQTVLQQTLCLWVSLTMAVCKLHLEEGHQQFIWDVFIKLPKCRYRYRRKPKETKCCFGKNFRQVWNVIFERARPFSFCKWTLRLEKFNSFFKSGISS